MSDPEAIDFEAALARLESLVGDLEAGELTLEDSLRSFEEGVRLVRLCSDRIQSAELRISELEAGADGIRERPLDVKEDS